jgi:hypothetical protein
MGMRKGPDYDKRKISVVVYDTYIPQWLTRQICSKNKPKLNTKYKAQHVKYIILFLFSFLTEWNSWSVYYIIFVFYFLQNGIAGPFWYAVGIMINIFIFPIFSVQFKTRAPGAKTYLQVSLLNISLHMLKSRYAYCCSARSYYES